MCAFNRVIKGRRMSVRVVRLSPGVILMRMERDRFVVAEKLVRFIEVGVGLMVSGDARIQGRPL